MSQHVHIISDNGEELRLSDFGIKITQSLEELIIRENNNGNNYDGVENNDDYDLDDDFKSSHENSKTDSFELTLDENKLNPSDISAIHYSIASTHYINAVQSSNLLNRRRSGIMPTTSDFANDEATQNKAKPTENLKGADEVYGLTKKQIDAFKEVFSLFDINGGGTIDASELDQALRSVDIFLNESEIEDILTIIDEDGNGEIDFDEFLNLMTSTEKYLATFGDMRRHSYQTILFNALTKFMKKSALASLSEIERYYHNKARKAPHVVAHYAAGARVIGLTEKQMAAHLASLPFKCKKTDSPYSQPVCKLPEENNRFKKKKGKGKIRLKVKFGKKKKNKLNSRSRSHKHHTKMQLQRDALAAYRIKLREGPIKLDVKPLTEMPSMNTSELKRQTKSHLTIEDLPVIRTKVAEAQSDYKKRLNKCKENLYRRNPHLFDIDKIPSRLLKIHYQEILDTYGIFSKQNQIAKANKNLIKGNGRPWQDLLRVKYGKFYV